MSELTISVAVASHAARRQCSVALPENGEQKTGDKGTLHRGAPGHRNPCCRFGFLGEDGRVFPHTFIVPTLNGQVFERTNSSRYPVPDRRSRDGERSEAFENVVLPNFPPIWKSRSVRCSAAAHRQARPGRVLPGGGPRAAAPRPKKR